jgi:hypothetical protein
MCIMRFNFRKEGGSCQDFDEFCEVSYIFAPPPPVCSNILSFAGNGNHEAEEQQSTCNPPSCLDHLNSKNGEGKYLSIQIVLFKR